ncbi:alpha-glucoside-specific PTS transporter subunit IIBC [Photobacterium damselae]|uniref:alpha-glucoside-specific PTS transporter subunit IIBC n=1 Tax=Photobacterium damselae TaxID=38293 RepID=UPI0025429443|nr:alpha-glucoside-specific PTS transporter subunit IIBC [Photobacterium damselae]WIH18872.1 alpha-glucoside-specific PTS transporter subunit IIBC [Photobacterium damselae]
MLSAIQRLGGAMFTPVLLFPFVGILVGLTIVLKNPVFVGDLADKNTLYYQVLQVIEEGGWTIFRNMALLFAIGLPIGLAKTAHARAVMVVMVSYLTFNYFVGAMGGFWGHYFGVDFSQPIGGTSGLTEIAGIKTIDTGIFGAIIISGLVTWIHNRTFEKQLPAYLGIFQGASYVAMLSFFAMLPAAWLTLYLWPSVQHGILGLQTFFVESGAFGVWLFTALERILIPTGLHHFIYTPFQFGNVVTPNGITVDWFSNLESFTQSSQSMKELFPAGGFSLHGNSKVFGCAGIALAMYFSAKAENRKKVAALLIPATFTAILVGITEPLEFTFLFIAPWLFAIHAVLAGTMAMVMYSFGVVGNMGGGLIEFVTGNWIPLLGNHTSMVVTQIVIGLSFTAIYFVVFKFLIIKFDVPIAGRSNGEMKLHTKEDFNHKHGISGKGTKGSSPLQVQAIETIEGLGGVENLEDLSNCATRLRVTVKDPTKVAPAEYFMNSGAVNLVKNGNAVQVIIGLSVPQLREECEKIVSTYKTEQYMDELTPDPAN